MGKRADRAYLVGDAYSDARGFLARRSLYEQQEPPVDLVGEVVALLDPEPGALVADVGWARALHAASLNDLAAAST